MLQRLVAIAALLLAASCSSTAGSPSLNGGAAGAASGGTAGSGSAGGPPNPAPDVQLGIPGGADNLEFEPLADGAELKLQTLGQGGTHVIVAVRCIGFGNRAFVSATLQNLSTNAVVEEPAPTRPQLLDCSAGDACDLLPYLVHASGLTATDAEKNGLHVRLTAKVHNESGVNAEGSVEAVLSTANL